MKFYVKKGKTNFEPLISPSFDVLGYSPIVHINPMSLGLPFHCTNEVPRNHNQIGQSRHWSGTHFRLLAGTLI